MTPFYADDWLTVLAGDARTVLQTLASGSVDCVVTSPPYWQQRSYLADDHELKAQEIGREPTFAEWVAELVAVCELLRRVLKAGGSLWINLGDRYCAYGGPTGARHNDWYVPRANGARQRSTIHGFPAGVRKKSLLLAPYRFAIAMEEAGWILRDKIVWSKTNALPESVGDRFSVRDEVLFRFVADERAYFDDVAVLEPYSAATLVRLAGGRAPTFSSKKSSAPGLPTRSKRYSGRHFRRRQGKNPGNVWSLPTASRNGNRFGHFAMFPPELIRRPILATCPPGGVVLDPFAGTGTTAEVANELLRRAVLIELDPASLAAISVRCSKRPIVDVPARAAS